MILERRGARLERAVGSVGPRFYCCVSGVQAVGRVVPATVRRMEWLMSVGRACGHNLRLS